MPPRTRHRVRTNVYLGPWERALTSYIQNATNVVMSEQLREALPLYVRQHPAYDAARLRRWVLEVYLPKLETDEERAATRLALEEFLRGSTAPGAPGHALPKHRARESDFDLDLQAPGKLSPARRRPIRSKASDFDD